MSIRAVKTLQTKLEAYRRRMRRLVRDFVVSRYISAGLQWGEAASYLFIGPCVGYDAMERRLKKWEARYVRYGFQPVRQNTWILAGGYGVAMEQELYIPNSQADRPNG